MARGVAGGQAFAQHVQGLRLSPHYQALETDRSAKRNVNNNQGCPPESMKETTEARPSPDVGMCYIRALHWTTRARDL